MTPRPPRCGFRWGPDGRHVCAQRGPHTYHVTASGDAGRSVEATDAGQQTLDLEDT